MLEAVDRNISIVLQMMNIFRKNKKVNPSNESANNTTTTVSNPQTPNLSINVNVRNTNTQNPSLSPPATKPPPLNLDSTTRIVPIHSNSSYPSSNLTPINFLGNFSLPSINSPNVPKNSNGELSRQGLGFNFNSNSNSSGSFSSSMASVRGGKEYKNKLNEVKAALDIENTEFSPQKPNHESPLTPFNLSNGLARPSVLTPINFPEPSSLPFPGRPARRDIKNFTFDPHSEPTKNMRPQKLDLPNNEKGPVYFDLIEKNSSHSSTETPLSLNIPSSRSTSASSVSSSTTSLSMQYRLEAASDKFREIMTNAGYLLIGENRIKTTMNELVQIGELGSGTCGCVYKMRHEQTGYQMAVKQMCISGIVEENKRIIMDLDVVAKCNSCKYIVKCLGYFISESDVWICMELMSMCFDKLLKLNKGPIPEQILGKFAVSILQALNYLKEKHSIIHRDIKPSNILIDENGEIKLCDFGISGNLINSKALTRNNTGCAGYMAPERIDVDPKNPVYDIRADVWSLGITLVELATGQYPYKNSTNDFEVMSTILESDAPELKGDQFSDMFKSFIKLCLTKDVSKRPKYNTLLKHEFIRFYSEAKVDVKSWLKSVLEKKNTPDSDAQISFEEKLNEINQEKVDKNEIDLA